MEGVFLLGRQANIDDKAADLVALVRLFPRLVNFVHRSRSMSLLHTACYYDRRECVEALLRLGADANVAAEDGFTALHWAAMLGHPDCVAALLSAANIDVNPLSITGWTPLARAFSRLPGNTDQLDYRERLRRCIGIMLDHKASLDNVRVKLRSFRLEWTGPRKLDISF